MVNCLVFTMEIYRDIIVFAAGFSLVALASQRIGQLFARLQLPLITGFLFAGVIAGPSVLGLIPPQAFEHLRFVDEIALAFIAFAAGGELYLKELRSRLRSIRWVTAGLVVATFSLGSLSVLALADLVPFIRSMSLPARIAVSILAGAILVARSPSSAIAIVNELRAQGPFTQTVLGVTVIMDVVVIVLLAINSEIADALLTELPIDVTFAVLLIGELAASLAIAFLLGMMLRFILSLRQGQLLKTALVLLSGYGVFVASAAIRSASHARLPFEILLEPLLICMAGSFMVINHSPYRNDLLRILRDAGPPVFIAFFTLTGASLALDVLLTTWPIALALFIARLVGVGIGSFTGGAIAGDPRLHNRSGWMAYITQAGVGLGLAKEVSVEFPEFGAAFATMMISVIVLNQVVGPPFFKWAIKRVGEAHTRARTPEFDGVRDAIIFGLEDQSLALARQLCQHGWAVRIATRKRDRPEKWQASDVDITPILDVSLETLHHVEVGKAEAVVAMMSDDDNYRLCQLLYEHFGTETVVVRLHERARFERFHHLGALVVDPGTAMVSLMDHMVRSPVAASLILGMEADQDIIDVEVRNPDLHGLALRDLRLPLDTLVLSIHRRGHMIISHGYTRLELGDRVSIVGSFDSLEDVILRMSG